MSTEISSDPRHQPAGFVQERLDAMLRMTSDPSFDITGMPPNMGNFPLKHVDTFSGRASNFALAYLPSDEAIQHSWQNAKAMRNDVGIAECIEARQRCTALLDWHLEPENDSSHEQKELCAELTKIIERIPRFVEYRNNLMHAIWYGKYAVQNRYRWVSIEGRDRVMPARVRDSAGWLPINGDKLVFRFDDGDPLKADQLGIRVGAGYGIGSDFNGYKVERAEPTGQGLAYFLPDWQRDALCVHKHMIEDADWEDPRNAGTIHGVGIRSRIYWEWFQKQNALAFLMEYLERSAGGMEVWTYPAGDPTALANAKAAARERMGNGRNIIFFPKPLGEAGDMYDVRIIEAGMAGIESLKDILITYFGHRIKRYILGQTLSTEAEATGLGSGVADLHLDSLLQIVKYDATNLEETLTYDLVRNLKNWNFPWAKGIHVRFVIDTESPEVEKKLQAWTQAWQMGAKLKASDVMELIGASPPGPNDEVLQQPQQMGGMPGQEPGGNQFAGVDLNELAERAKQQVTAAITGTPEPERYSATFDESKIKRDGDGKFAEKEGGTATDEKPDNHPVKSWAAKKFDNPEHAKAFVEWFGDSKVVDEKGEPLVVYHGTASNDEFEKFTPSGAASKKAPGAIWFAQSPEMANIHALRKPGKGRVIPSFVAITNPKVIDMSGSDEAPDHSELWDAADEGHDGVIFVNAKDGNSPRSTVFAALDSSQIKSATGNAGTFDPKDNRITYAADPSNKDSGWRTIGGSPVHIGANGTIDAGCPGLKGEDVEDLIDEDPESRKKREVRQTHAEARGLTGHDVSASQAKKLHNQGLEKQYEAAATAAKKFGVATADVVRALPDAHQMLLEQWSVEEQARKRARQMTGLNAGVLAKIENSYRDYSSVPGFDDAAASMAEEFPHLGFGRSGDIAAEVWEFMRHGSDKQPQLHDEATAELAAEIVAKPKKQQADESEVWTDSGFEDGELVTAGGGFDDSFDPDKFAKKGTKSQDGQGEFRWITLNGGDGDGGGTHVKINGKGDIVAGPAGLADKGIKNLKDFGKDETPKKESAPKREPEYSDQEKSYREAARTAEEVMSAGPDEYKNLSIRDLTVARGHLLHEVRVANRRLEKGDISKSQRDSLVDSLEREADFMGKILADHINGRSIPPENMTRAEKIAEKAYIENKSPFSVAREMGMTSDEYRDVKKEIDSDIEDRREMESANNQPSDARKRAMESQRARQSEPEGVPGQQMGLFNADEFKTGQMQLFNVVRPSGKKSEPTGKGLSELEKIEDELKADAEKSKSLPGQQQLEESSGKSLVKERRDKQMSASHNPSQLRAKSGGEYGPNGEWYDGGAWIATTDMPKKVKQKIAQAATGKVVIEPGKYEVPPAGKISILDAIGGTYFNHRDGELNHTFMDYQKLGDEERQQVKDAADAYKNGERFVDAAKFWGIAKFNDIARMMEAEMPLPGKLADAAKRAFGASFEKYKPNKTSYSRLASHPTTTVLANLLHAFKSQG